MPRPGRGTRSGAARRARPPCPLSLLPALFTALLLLLSRASAQLPEPASLFAGEEAAGERDYGYALLDVSPEDISAAVEASLPAGILPVLLPEDEYSAPSEEYDPDGLSDIELRQPPMLSDSDYSSYPNVTTRPCPDLNFTQTARCGRQHGDLRCRGWFCCSVHGYCGNGTEWCQDACQVGFGVCWGNSTATCGNGAVLPPKTRTPTDEPTPVQTRQQLATAPAQGLGDALVNHPAPNPFSHNLPHVVRGSRRDGVPGERRGGDGDDRGRTAGALRVGRRRERHAALLPHSGNNRRRRHPLPHRRLGGARQGSRRDPRRRRPAAAGRGVCGHHVDGQQDPRHDEPQPGDDAVRAGCDDGVDGAADHREPAARGGFADLGRDGVSPYVDGHRTALGQAGRHLRPPQPPPPQHPPLHPRLRPVRPCPHHGHSDRRERAAGRRRRRRPEPGVRAHLGRGDHAGKGHVPGADERDHGGVLHPGPLPRRRGDGLLVLDRHLLDQSPRRRFSHGRHRPFPAGSPATRQVHTRDAPPRGLWRRRAVHRRRDAVPARTDVVDRGGVGERKVPGAAAHWGGADGRVRAVRVEGAGGAKRAAEALPEPQLFHLRVRDVHHGVVDERRGILHPPSFPARLRAVGIAVGPVGAPLDRPVHAGLDGLRHRLLPEGNLHPLPQGRPRGRHRRPRPAEHAEPDDAVCRDRRVPGDDGRWVRRLAGHRDAGGASKLRAAGHRARHNGRNVLAHDRGHDGHRRRRHHPPEHRPIPHHPLVRHGPRRAVRRHPPGHGHRGHQLPRRHRDLPLRERDAGRDRRRAGCRARGVRAGVLEGVHRVRAAVRGGVAGGPVLEARAAQGAQARGQEEGGGGEGGEGARGKGRGGGHGDGVRTDGALLGSIL